MKPEIEIYDTTLRDGSQGEGSNFSVADKLGMRQEGISERFLQIRGVWEDHVRYAITAEEWAVRGPALKSTWLKRA